MKKTTKLSQIQIKNIATKHNIKEEIMQEIIIKMDQYASILHESLSEFSIHPEMKYDDEIWSFDFQDRLELSLFYHENKEMLNHEKFNIIEQVKFIPYKTNKRSLKLSHRIANKILKAYFSKIDKKIILKQDDIEDFLSKPKNRGKKPSASVNKRNNMIYTAVQILRKNGIEKYSKVLNDILPFFGYEEETGSNLNKVISDYDNLPFLKII